jgi:hypothetical protein
LQVNLSLYFKSPYYLRQLFTTPIKHKIPKRELEMDEKFEQTTLHIPTINKAVVVLQIWTKGTRNFIGSMDGQDEELNW